MSAILPPDDETRLVRDFFGGATGYFVDVGANDPQLGSQSWHLEQAGWSGILIEPQPDLAARLTQARKAKVFAVACSAPANAGKSMPLYLAGPLSSLSEVLMDATQKAEVAVAVPVRTLDQVLTEAAAPAPIDFLSIDVEGHAREVLQGVDLARWRPRLILVEDHVMNLRLHRHLRSRGYRWIRRTGLNSWYVPAEAAAQVGAFGRWQFFRKYVLGVPFRHFREASRRARTRAKERRSQRQT
jgi:FkbM family methyltransferase